MLFFLTALISDRRINHITKSTVDRWVNTGLLLFDFSGSYGEPQWDHLFLCFFAFAFYLTLLFYIDIVSDFFVQFISQKIFITCYITLWVYTYYYSSLIDIVLLLNFRV